MSQIQKILLDRKSFPLKRQEFDKIYILTKIQINNKNALQNEVRFCYIFILMIIEGGNKRFR